MTAALGALVALERALYIGAAMRTGGFAPDRLEGIDSRNGMAETAVVLTGIVAGVAWLVWFSRLYSNLPFLGASIRFSTRWAVAAWLVPFLNLSRPVRMTVDAWRASHPEAPDHLKLGGAPAPAVIKWWWALFVAAPVAVRLGQSLSESTTAGPGDIQFASWIQVIGHFLLVIAAVLALRVAATITDYQDARVKRRS